MTTKLSADFLISKLGLEHLDPEGGFFRQTFKSKEMTAIYYLVTEKEFSAFHRVKSTEIYHYYGGESLELFLLDSKLGLQRNVLGSRFDLGEVSQLIIPPNTWQACRIANPTLNSWTLVGATVSPGFESENFELGKHDQLLSEFPFAESVIRDLIRK